MTEDKRTEPLILVVEDVHEIRYGIEKLLIADGYRVSLARDEAEAMEKVQHKCPDLMLVSLPTSLSDVILSVARIRKTVDGGDQMPAVIFCIEGIAEGDEIAIGQHIHLTLPDNFNQLRGLLSRLLKTPPNHTGASIVQQAN